MELVTSEALPAFPASVLPSCFWTFEPFPLHSAPLSLLLSAYQRAFFKHPICAKPRTPHKTGSHGTAVCSPAGPCVIQCYLPNLVMCHTSHLGDVHSDE